MADDRYFLTGKDVREQREINRIVRGGNFRNRPTPQRRRNRSVPGGSEKNRIIRATVDEGSGVTAGNTFTVDNIEPLCSGLDPSAGVSSFTLEIDNARNDYADNATIFAIEDTNAANGWSDFTGTGSETYRLVRGLVNEGSGVTAGASFTIDNVEALAGGELPVASTADDVDLEIDEAKQAYSDNDEVIAIYDPAATNDWVDFSDVGDVPPQTYNVKLQGVAKALTDTSVSVKFLEDDLTTENGAAFDAYDPHQKFSSGKVTDAVGRVTRVTDPDTGNNRFEFTALTSLARYVTATLAENEGATTSGKASASSYEAKGNGWHVTSPTGSINIIGLDGQQAGDQVRAVLVDPDSTPQEYLAVQVPDKNDDEKFKISANDTTAGYFEDKIANSGTYNASNHQLVYRQTINDGSNETSRLFTDKAAAATEQERIIVGQLKAPSGVAIGTATFVIDNVRPLASGTDPVGGNAATEVTINDAIGGYVDNQEIRAVWDDAENTGSGGWKDATIHRFTRIRGLVNEGSGVAEGASGWAVDNIELLAGSADPGATVDGYVAKQAYSNNDEVELIWNDETVRWEDCTDLNEAGEPQTYNVKLQAAKTKAATSVSVKFLEDDLTTENGSAFTAYDPHGQFSSGKVTDAIGRVTRVTDPDTGNNRFELTHLRQLAEYVRGDLSTDESSGSATDTGGYTAWGGAWQDTSPTGTITITGLDGQKAGDEYVAVLEDPDSTPQKYRMVEFVRSGAPLGVIEPVSIILDVPARSGAVAGSAASSGDIYAMCNADNVGQSGVVIHGRTYDFTSASLGELIEPNTPVTVRLFNHSLNAVEAPASGLLFCDAKKIGDGGAQEEYQIVSPLELRTLTGFDGDGTADQVITHVDGDIEWEDTGACS